MGLLSGSLYGDNELAVLPRAQQTAIPSLYSDYEILDATRVRVTMSKSPADMRMPASYVKDPESFPEYQVTLFRPPADLTGATDSSDNQGGWYTVVETPAGANGLWVLELYEGSLPGSPGGVIAAPSTSYFLTAGAYLGVDFAQTLASETDVRVTVRTTQFGVTGGVPLRARVEIWDFIWAHAMTPPRTTYPDATFQAWYNYYRSDGSYISQDVQVALPYDQVYEYVDIERTPPADCASATLNIRFIVPQDLPGENLRATFGNAWIINDADTTWPPEDPVEIDLFETATGLEIIRADLDAGTATLTTSDPAFDVLQGTTALPKGARARIVAYNNSLVHPTNAELLWTGAILDAQTTYPTRRGIPYPLTVVTLADGMSKLASSPRPYGYSEITRLPEALEGAGVPWNTAGNRNQSYGTEPADTYNESASALDQVALTRDGILGYAYMDRYGVINVHTEDNGTGTIYSHTREFDFDENNFNDDAIPGISSQDVINTVMIKAQGAFPSDDTDNVYGERTFGPYVDRVSVDKYGVRAEEFEITVPYDDAISGAVTTEYLRPFANEILARNAQPYLKFEELSFGVTDNWDSGRNIRIIDSTVDVGDLVNLTSPTAGMVAVPHRVRAVSHSITADSWVMTLGFAGQQTVASPASQPSLRGAISGESEWVTWTKVSPSASMANVTFQYRITGKFIEFRLDGNLAADVSIPASGDNGNQNVTSSFPANMRPEVGNWGWAFSVGRTAFMYLTPGGTVTWANSAGAAGTVTAGTSVSHQSPAFVLP
jgi:hypothetical protein